MNTVDEEESDFLHTSHTTASASTSNPNYYRFTRSTHTFCFHFVDDVRFYSIDEIEIAKLYDRADLADCTRSLAS